MGQNSLYFSQKGQFYRFLVIVLPLFFLCMKAAAKPYEMADLEVLTREQNTREFLAHALDIRPSLRDKSWREMVSQMSQLAIKEASQRRPLTLTSFDHIQKIATWPSLEVDDYFQLKRADFASFFFKGCFKSFQAHECLSRLQRFRSTSKDNPNLTLEFLTLLKEYVPTSSRKELLISITKGSFAAEFCRRKMIQDELLGTLLAAAQKEMGQSGQASTLKVLDYAEKACLQQLEAPLKEGLFASEMIEAKASFYVLRQMNALTREDYDQFYTYYLLSLPKSSELFNLAWNNLKSLGSSEERRQRVMAKLTQLDPVPGKSFGAPDITMRRTIAEAFLVNFPEFTSYYIKQCLSYLEGLKSYPRGNPTPYCDDLMMVGKMGHTISDEVYFKHSALKKFKPLK